MIHSLFGSELPNALDSKRIRKLEVANAQRMHLKVATDQESEELDEWIHASEIM